MTTMTEQLLDRAAQKAADTILLVYASSKGALKSEIVRAIKVEFATIQQVATPEAIGYLTHDSVKALLEMGRKQRSHRSTMVCNLPRHACCVPIYTAAPAQAATDEVPDAWKLMLAGVVRELDATYKALGQDGSKPVVSIGQFRRLRTAKQFLLDAGLPNIDLDALRTTSTDTQKGGAT